MMVADRPRVFISGAIRGDRSLAQEIVALVAFIKTLDVVLLTDHVGATDPIEDFAKKVGKAKEALTAEDIERQDIAWIDDATHLVAEISGASTGTGREIEYARTKGCFGRTPAQILCLYRQDREFTASPMIRGMTPDRYPNVRVCGYAHSEEAKRLAKEFLGR